ncbi:hypothetical protein [uncultured Campylobacter sp.]|uniref:hypothetical protein n=1 Tax=uncultured Campylobacter sp. TaxID=218934 RepID=UPI002629E890|nr:hypothetical protein [uncultured Campylobacter sp.]
MLIQNYDSNLNTYKNASLFKEKESGNFEDDLNEKIKENSIKTNEVEKTESKEANIEVLEKEFLFSLDKILSYEKDILDNASDKGLKKEVNSFFKELNEINSSVKTTLENMQTNSENILKNSENLDKNANEILKDANVLAQDFIKYINKILPELKQTVDELSTYIDKNLSDFDSKEIKNLISNIDSYIDNASLKDGLTLGNNTTISLKITVSTSIQIIRINEIEFNFSFQSLSFKNEMIDELFDLFSINSNNTLDSANSLNLIKEEKEKQSELSKLMQKI